MVIGPFALKADSRPAALMAVARVLNSLLLSVTSRMVLPVGASGALGVIAAVAVVVVANGAVGCIDVATAGPVVAAICVG